MCPAAQAPHRRPRLTSNVRLHMTRWRRLAISLTTLTPSMAFAQAQGSWGGAVGLPALILGVIAYSIGGIAAFVYLSNRRPGFALICVILGIVAVTLFPGACLGQSSGYQCPDAAQFFAFAVPFFGCSWGAAMVLAVVSSFLPRRPTDAT